MHLRLRSIALCLVGLVLTLVSAVAGTATRAPTATPSAFPPGITFEPLVESPPGPLGLPGPDGPGTMIEVMARITYAPGASFDFHVPGPILFYIEQGTLTVQLNQGHVGLVTPGRIPIAHSGTAARGIEPVTVPAGQGIYADDGYIGATRNNGPTPAVVLTTYLYTMANGVHHHVTATVAPSVSTPAS